MTGLPWKLEQPAGVSPNVVEAFTALFVLRGNSLYNLLYLRGSPCDTNELLFSVTILLKI